MLSANKSFLHRHLIIPWSMKLRSFNSTLKELNVFLEEFPPNTEGQESAPLPEDETMDIIYHSMLASLNNKMIEQGFN